MTFERPSSESGDEPWADKEFERTEGYRQNLAKQRANLDAEPASDPPEPAMEEKPIVPGTPEWQAMKDRLAREAAAENDRIRELRRGRKKTA